ncbi:hypothetical protein CCP4SC76_7270004 [Gammaproteobacteria bacterium]
MLKSVAKLFRGRSVLEQHVAIFGESGSGKTTLLSAFYGWQQEPKFRTTYGYGINAIDTTTGQRLRSNYLKMAESLLPPQTRYSHDPIEFTINVRGLDSSAGKLVWHDYPGEWWTETKSGTEGERKIETLKTLLRSDIALLLCDGSKLKEKKSKYIRDLIRGFREELERHKNTFVQGGERLKLFPRIWIICLSKADLFPGRDVCWFRDQVIESSSDELEELRQVIGEIIGGDQFKSLGEDFLMLSSAKFDLMTGKVIDAFEHVGVDMIMPLAVMLPIKKALFWQRSVEATSSITHRFVDVSRSITTDWMKYIPIIGSVFWSVDDVAKSGIKSLKSLEDEARKRGDSVGAVIAALGSRLDGSSSKMVYYSSTIL